MIIGAEILDDEHIEITLIPLTTVKKKTSLSSLLCGDLESLQQMVQQSKQHHTKIVMLQKDFVDMGLKIAKHVTVEVLSDNTTGGVE